MGLAGQVWYPDLDQNIDNLNAVLAQMASSVNDAMPVKVATSLAQINAMPGPDGALVILITSNGGVTQGAMWSKLGTGWNLTSGARVDVSTFVASLATYSALYTMPGTTFYDNTTNSVGTWSNASGGATYSIGGGWTTIPYTVSGTGAPSTGLSLAYKQISGGVMLRGGVKKTSGTFHGGNPVIQLPSAARPPVSCRIQVPGDSYAIGNMTVQATGLVEIYGVMNVSPRQFFFDGIIIPQDD